MMCQTVLVNAYMYNWVVLSVELCGYGGWWVDVNI